MKNVLLEKIWHEFKNGLSVKEYGRLFVDQQIYRRKIYDIIIILCSSSGAIGTILSKYIPVIATIIIASVSILKETSSLFFLRGEDLMQLRTLLIECDNYTNQMQSLHDLLDADKITEKKAQDEFTKLYEGYSAKRESISAIFGKINQRIEKKAIINSNQYLFNVYNVKIMSENKKQSDSIKRYITTTELPHKTDEVVIKNDLPSASSTPRPKKENK